MKRLKLNLNLKRNSFVSQLKGKKERNTFQEMIESLTSKTNALLDLMIIETIDRLLIETIDNLISHKVQRVSYQKLL